jgi:hypothetical protein
VRDREGAERGGSSNEKQKRKEMGRDKEEREG